MGSRHLINHGRFKSIILQTKLPKVSTTQRLLRESQNKVKSVETAFKNRHQQLDNSDPDDEFDPCLKNFEDPLKYFRQNSKTRIMDLDSCSLGPVLIDEISQKYFPTMTVTCLLLGNCRLGNEGTRIVLKALASNFTVEELNLSENGITVCVMDVIGKFLQSNMTLEKLSLAGNYLIDSAVDPLMTYMRSNCHLKELDLSRNILTDEFGKSVGVMLTTNKNLESLHLASNQLADSGLAAMSTGLQKSKYLKYLDVSWNYLFDSGAKEVAEIIKYNKSLTSIKVCGNFIRKQGAIYIGDSLKKNSTLYKLNLGHNLIKKEGAHLLLRALSQSVDNNLRELDINGTIVGCDFTATLENEVNEKLPDLKVLHYIECDEQLH